MAEAWELISSEHRGQVGRRPLVAKTYRLPDGSQAGFTITGNAGSQAVACVALTPAGTVVLAEETGFVPATLTYLGEMRYDGYGAVARHYFLAAGCQRRHDQRLDPGEFVTVREVTPAELVRLALNAALTDPGGVLLALPYLAGDPGVAALLAARPLP